MTTPIKSSEPSKAFIQNENRQNLSRQFRENNVADKHLYLRKKALESLLPPLLAGQQEKVESYLNTKFPVCDDEGQLYFHITLLELWHKITEIAGTIPGLTLVDVRLVGSGLSAVIDNSDFYSALAGCWLNKPLTSLDLTGEGILPNDLDIRFYFNGATKEIRFQLSRKLIKFYTDLSKVQQTERLANEVTALFLKEHSRRIRASLEFTIKNHLQNFKEGSLDAKEIGIIKLLAERVIQNHQLDPKKVRSDPSVLHFVTVKVSALYFMHSCNLAADHIKKDIFHYFSHPSSDALPKLLKEEIDRVAEQQIKNSIFNKLSNPEEGEKGNNYLIHSFGGVEVLCISSLERQQSQSPDAPQWSLLKKKFHSTPDVNQGLCDRMLRLVRPSNKVKEQDFPRYLNYLTQGFDPPQSEDEERLIKAFIHNRSLDNQQKLLSRFIEEHLKKGRLELLTFLFNGCLAFNRYGYADGMIILLKLMQCASKNSKKDPLETILESMIFTSKNSIKDLEAILITIAALYLRLGQNTQQAEFIIRLDLEEQILKLVLHKKANPYFIHFKYRPLEALERISTLVNLHPEMSSTLHLFYKHFIDPEASQDTALLMLAKELGFSKMSANFERGVWSRLLSQPESQGYEKLVKEAKENSLFTQLNPKEIAIWNASSYEDKCRFLRKIFYEGSTTKVWSIALQNSLLLDFLIAEVFLCKENFHGLAWHVGQIYHNLDCCSPSLRSKNIERGLDLSASKMPVGSWQQLTYKWMEIYVKECFVIEDKHLLTRASTFLTKMKRLSYDEQFPKELESAFRLKLPILFHHLLCTGHRTLIFEYLEVCSLLKIDLRSKTEPFYRYLQYTFGGFQGMIESGAMNPARLARLQKFIERLPEAMTFVPEDKIPIMEEAAAELLKSLLKQEMDVPVRTLIANLPKFSAKNVFCLLEYVQNSFNTLNILRVHKVLSQKDWGIPIIDKDEFKKASEKLLKYYLHLPSKTFPIPEFLDIVRLYPSLTPEIWALFIGQMSESTEISRINSLWIMWESVAYNRDFWKETPDLFRQAWFLASKIMSESKERRLIEILKHSEIFNEVCQGIKGLQILENIFKGLSQCELRIIKTEVPFPVVLQLHKMAETIVSQNLEGCFPESWNTLDQWWIEYCLLCGPAGIVEGISHLSTLATSSSPHLSRKILRHLYRSALSSSVYITSEKYPETYQILEDLLKVFKHREVKSWKILINALSDSEESLHRKLVVEQVKELLNYPQEVKGVDLDCLNEALLYLLSLPGEFDLIQIEKFLISEHCAKSDDMASSSIKWLELRWPTLKFAVQLSNSPLLQNANPFSYFIEEVIAKMSEKVIFSSKFQENLQELYKELIQNHQIRIFHRIYWKYVDAVNAVVNMRKEIFLAKTDSQTYQDLAVKNTSQHLTTFVMKGNSKNRAWSYISSHHSDLVRNLMSLYSSKNNFPDAVNAFILDHIYTTLTTIIVAGLLEKTVLFNLLDQFVYLCPPEQKIFFNYHLKDRVTRLLKIATMQKDSYILKELTKIYEYSCYIASNCENSQGLKLRDSILSFQTKREILRGLIVRLLTHKTRESDLHALDVLLEVSRSTVINHTEIVVELLPLLAPVLKKYASDVYNGQNLMGIFLNPSTLIPNQEACYKSKSTREICQRYGESQFDIFRSVRISHPGLTVEKMPITYIHIQWAVRMLPVFFDRYDEACEKKFEEWTEIIVSSLGTDEDNHKKWMQEISNLFLAESIVITEECYHRRALVCHKFIQALLDKEDRSFYPLIKSFFFSLLLTGCQTFSMHQFLEMQNLLIQNQVIDKKFI